MNQFRASCLSSSLISINSIFIDSTYSPQLGLQFFWTLASKLKLVLNVRHCICPLLLELCQSGPHILRPGTAPTECISARLATTPRMSGCLRRCCAETMRLFCARGLANRETCLQFGATVSPKNPAPTATCPSLRLIKMEAFRYFEFNIR